MCVFTEEEEARIATDEQKNLPKTSLFLAKILWLSTWKKITNKKPREFMILFLVATTLIVLLE